jgi:hypothetical protein
MIRCLISLPLLAFTLSAANIEVLYLGLLPGQAPAFERTLDRTLREHLTGARTYSLIDQERTETFSEAIDFQRYPSISPRMIDALGRYFNDSTLVVWVRLKRMVVSGARQGWFGSVINGALEADMVMYSLHVKAYSFVGHVQCSATKKGPILWFDPADKMEITALDKLEIWEELAARAAHKSSDIIGMIVRAAIAEENRYNTINEREKKLHPPTINDIFDFPSVETDTLDTTFLADSLKTLKPKLAPAKPKSGATKKTTTTRKTTTGTAAPKPVPKAAP